MELSRNNANRWNSYKPFPQQPQTTPTASAEKVVRHAAIFSRVRLSAGTHNKGSVSQIGRLGFIKKFFWKFSGPKGPTLLTFSPQMPDGTNTQPIFGVAF